MKKIYDFLTKYALVINITLFVLSFVLFFLPLNATPRKYAILGVKTYTPIMNFVKKGLEFPDFWINDCIVYLLFFLILWITQIISIVFSHKKPFLNFASFFPIMGMFIYTTYLFAVNNFIPHIGFILMLLLLIYYILEIVIYMVIKFPNPEPRSHKPSNRERIAELEQRIAELERKDVK